uniref:Uncharacterized protein n=1 Tax=Anopheles atroparvus TaxID=41427 RepID=A0A182IUJ8_ANOAO
MERSSGTRRSIRSNTFRIDYDGIPRRPSRSEVIDFVVDHLHLGANIAAIQHCNSLGRVYIEMQTAEQAREAVYLNGQKHAITVDGKAYAVPLSLEDGTTEVRLLELPSYVTVAEIKAEMASLG